LDALVAPGRVLAGQPLDQRGDGVVEGWATATVRVGPFPGDQAAVPPQDRGRGDEAMTAQDRGQASDQSGEHGSVSPVQAGLGVRSAENGDLVAQDEELDVLGRRGAAEQHQPAEKPVEDRIEQTQRHVGDHARPLCDADRRRSQTLADFWSPTGGTRHGLSVIGEAELWVKMLSSQVSSLRVVSAGPQS
jgi:hypothetical protein